MAPRAGQSCGPTQEKAWRTIIAVSTATRTAGMTSGGTNQLVAVSLFGLLEASPSFCEPATALEIWFVRDPVASVMLYVWERCGRISSPSVSALMRD